MSAGVKKKHGKEAILAEKSWKRCCWYSCKSSCCNGSLIISFFFCSSREHDEAVKSREKMKAVIKYLWSQVRG